MCLQHLLKGLPLTPPSAHQHLQLAPRVSLRISSVPGGPSLHFNHRLSGCSARIAWFTLQAWDASRGGGGGEGCDCGWSQALLPPPPGRGALGRRCRTSVQGGAGWGSVYTAAGVCGAPVGCCSSLPAASARVFSETASDCPCSPSPGLPHGLAKIQTSSLAWRRARM